MKPTKDKSKKTKIKMDKIHNEYDIYERIFTWSAGFMITLVDVYIILITNGVDLVNFEYVQNPLLRALLQFVVQVVLFAVIGVCVYKLHYIYEEKKWIKMHSEKWVQGEWLHIHEKKNVRIGYVKIRQRFSSIDVHGAVNITPNVYGIQKKNKTTWGYQSATFLTDNTDLFELLCCYEAKSSGQSKPGIHHFTESKNDDDNIPYMIKGTFSDTLKSLENSRVAKNDADGDLYLFKINDRIRPFITDGKNIDYDKLANILDNENLKDEKFCTTLDRVIRKYGYVPLHEAEEATI